jgi:hypothetical protein
MFDLQKTSSNNTISSLIERLSLVKSKLDIELCLNGINLQDHYQELTSLDNRTQLKQILNNVIIKLSDKIDRNMKRRISRLIYVISSKFEHQATKKPKSDLSEAQYPKVDFHSDETIDAKPLSNINLILENLKSCSSTSDMDQLINKLSEIDFVEFPIINMISVINTLMEICSKSLESVEAEGVVNAKVRRKVKRLIDKLEKTVVNSESNINSSNRSSFIKSSDIVTHQPTVSRKMPNEYSNGNEVVKKSENSNKNSVKFKEIIEKFESITKESDLEIVFESINSLIRVSDEPEDNIKSLIKCLENLQTRTSIVRTSKTRRRVHRLIQRLHHLTCMTQMEKEASSPPLKRICSSNP